MSLLTRTAVRSTRSIGLAPRAFSTSLATRKTPTEAVKDTAKTVDRKVSNKLVDGIEIGQAATKKAKNVVGINSAEDAKAKAAEFTEKAKERAHEAAGEARKKTDDAASEARKKTDETAKDVKEKAEKTKERL